MEWGPQAQPRAADRLWRICMYVPPGNPSDSSCVALSLPRADARRNAAWGTSRYLNRPSQLLPASPDERPPSKPQEPVFCSTTTTMDVTLLVYDPLRGHGEADVDGAAGLPARRSLPHVHHARRARIRLRREGGGHRPRLFSLGRADGVAALSAKQACLWTSSKSIWTRSDGSTRWR